MALDATRMGTAIAAAVKASAPVAGTPITDSQLQAIWIAASVEIIKEFTDNGQVLPGSFQDAETRPIVGAGVIS